jgi:hypothetical protein
VGQAFRRHYSTIISAERRAHDLIDAFPRYFDRREAILNRRDNPKAWHEP